MFIDKGTKSYSYMSRYANFETYYDTESKKYVYGVTRWLSTDTPYISYVVKKGDTYDSIALEKYGNPTLYWLITDFNRVADPFENPQPGYTIKIPIYSSVEFDI